MIQMLGIGVIAALLFFLQEKIYRKLWRKGLDVDIVFETENIFEGEQGTLKEYVENRKYLPLPMLKVKFQTSRFLDFGSVEGSRTTDQYYRNDIFQIDGGERIIRTLLFTGRKRGFYGIENIDLVASDLFMTREMADTVRLRRSVYVLPKPFDSREFLLSLRQLSGEILCRRYQTEDPFEFRGIREYQPSDDMRSINWKATAKTGDLRVNQYGYTALRTVRIFLNLEDSGILKKTECVEASIRIAAGLNDFFLRQGFQVACFASSRDVVTGKPLLIEAGAGADRQINTLRALARLDTDREPENFVSLFEERLLKGSAGSFTCVIAPNQYGEFTSLMERLQESGREYLWFYPVSGDGEPSLPEGLRAHIRVLHIGR